MAKITQEDHEQTVSHQNPMELTQPPRGSVRSCRAYRDELQRHRVITADGLDFAVATHRRPGGKGFITGAYPVQQGYLVMVRQPLCELRSDNEESARGEHDNLVQVLAEAGIGVVRARRTLAARQRAEKADPRRFSPPALTLVPPTHQQSAEVATF